MTVFREYCIYPLFRFDVQVEISDRLANILIPWAPPLIWQKYFSLSLRQTNTHTQKKKKTVFFHPVETLKKERLSGRMGRRHSTSYTQLYSVMLLLVKGGERGKKNNFYILNYLERSRLCGPVCCKRWQIGLDLSPTAALQRSVCDRGWTAVIKPSSNSSGPLPSTDWQLRWAWALSGGTLWFKV